MSNAIFPSFPGLKAEVSRTPVWSTTHKPSVSQRDFRSANASYPLYKYKLSYEVLRQTTGFAEFTTMVGFFNARRGSFDSFLFTDPDDCAVTAQPLGPGDGVNRMFQLVRNFGGFIELVFDTNSAPLVYLDGVLQTLTTNYTVSGIGVVTFVVAPGAGVAVTWSGTYYRRVRFEQDAAEFNKFMDKLWALKTLELITVKL